MQIRLKFPWKRCDDLIEKDKEGDAVKSQGAWISLSVDKSVEENIITAVPGICLLYGPLPPRKLKFVPPNGIF